MRGASVPSPAAPFIGGDNNWGCVRTAYEVGERNDRQFGLNFRYPVVDTDRSSWERHIPLSFTTPKRPPSSSTPQRPSA